MITSSAITWLEEILRNRIHHELRLTLSQNPFAWCLSCPTLNGSLLIPIIPSLYSVGFNQKLPCAYYRPKSDNIYSDHDLIPAPGLSHFQFSLLSYNSESFQINYDIIGLIYWMLSRCEEVDVPASLLDIHERFPSSASHAFRYNYLYRPIVDEWILILRQVIKLLWPNFPHVSSQFNLILTHDVDSPSAYAFTKRRLLPRLIISDIIKYRRLNSLLAPWIRISTKDLLSKYDPHNTFNWLMSLSESLNVQSSFYFICGRTDKIRDSQYEPDHPAIRNLLKSINDRGHQIGLHPSYNTFQSLNQISLEFRRLRTICQQENINQDCWGSRMHVLRWRWPDTARALEEAGLNYDSTLCYADRPGFRCGTCHPFRMFDPVLQRSLSLIQRPLIAMECSVIASRYLGLGRSSASENLFLLLKERCRLVSGDFILLWHNNSFCDSHDRNLYHNICIK